MTIGDVATRQGPRVSIVNTSTAQAIQAQFNPQQFKASIRANYTNHPSPGAGYEPQHFNNTGNVRFPLELFYFIRDEQERAQRAEAEKFLSAFLFPRRGAANIPAASPPKALVVWPDVVALVCIVTAIEVDTSLFDVNGKPIQTMIKLDLEESRSQQLFSEDVAERGFLRANTLALGAGGRRYGYR